MHVFTGEKEPPMTSLNPFAARPVPPHDESLERLVSMIGVTNLSALDATLQAIDTVKYSGNKDGAARCARLANRLATALREVRECLPSNPLIERNKP